MSAGGTPSGGSDANVRNIKEPLGSIQNVISIVIAFAGFLTTLVGSFVLPPIFNVDVAQNIGGVDKLVSAGRFFVAVLVGVSMYPVLRYSARRYLWRWVAVAIACLISGSMLYSKLISDEVYYVHHVDYPKGGIHITFVIGDQLTNAGENYVRDFVKRYRRQPGPLDIYGFFSAMPEPVYQAWERESVLRREFMFAAEYLAILASFSYSIVAAGQAVRCVAALDR